MIKQHCDYCDRVIPATEAYRTVHFGRGTNSRIDVGYDPIVVCKTCWKQMESVVKPEGETVENKENKQQLDSDIIGGLLKGIAEDGTEKGCKTCKHWGNRMGEEPCIACCDFDKWEANDVRSEGTL